MSPELAISKYLNNKKSLNHYRDECHLASVVAGWWLNTSQDTVPAKLCLIHSEISEAMEGVRKDLYDDHLPHRKMVEVELADAMIRLFDLAGYLNLDLEGAYNEKRAYNAQRADHKLENRAKANGKSF